LPEVSKQIPNNPLEFPFLKNFPLDLSDLLDNFHDGIDIADICIQAFKRITQEDLPWSPSSNEGIGTGWQ
jgi:hypothetical protein